MNLISLSLIAAFYVPATAVSVAKVFKPSTKVNVTNECPGTSEKFLAENTSIKNPETLTTTYSLGPSDGSSYSLVICTNTQCYRYGNMTFLADREYNMRLSQCDLPAIRIESHEVPTVKKGEAPHLRFRSRRVRHTEYRYDQTRFRRLSVGMSRYRPIKWPQEAGPTRIQFRYRVGSKGPVEYLSTHELKKLNPGHKYFIEVEYFGMQKESIKIQDEGVIVREKQ